MLDACGDDSWGKEPFTEQNVIEWMAMGGLYAVGHEREIVGVFATGPGGRDNLHVAYDWPESLTTTGECISFYIARFAVRESMHGQGVGAHILSWIGQKALSQGRDGLRVCTNSMNDRLQRYFKGQGFAELPYQEWRNTRHDFMYLQKRLRPTGPAPHMG